MKKQTQRLAIIVSVAICLLFYNSTPAFAYLNIIQIISYSMIDNNYTLSIPATSYQSESGIFSYKVKKGDTLTEIGRRYGIDPWLIVEINNLKNPNKINVGQEVKVPIIDEIKHRVNQFETLWEIANYYNVRIEEIMLANGIWMPELIYIGQEIVMPGIRAEVAITEARKITSRSSNNRFIWPVNGTLTSDYGNRHGEFHTGIDIANEDGTPIKASQSGWITMAGEAGNYGNCIIISHSDGSNTLYAHNSKIVVSQGQWVRQGDIISYMGSTGRTTGAHLHFEVIINGAKVNPLNYLK